MATDPILDEIRRTREELLDECGGNTHELVRAARERAVASDRPIVESKRRGVRDTRVTTAE